MKQIFTHRKNSFIILTALSLLLGFSSFSSHAKIYKTFSDGTFTVTAAITPDSCIESGLGAIDISVSGGSSPYTYLWSTSATTQDVSNLSAGDYTVTVYDNTGDSIVVTIPLDNYILWTNLIGMYQSADTLIKTASTSWLNAKASSTNLLEPHEDGYVEFSVPSLRTDTFGFGLVVSNGTASFDSIHYAMRYRNNNVKIYEGFTEVGSTTVQAGDYFRIAREGSNIVYYQNDTVLRTRSADANERLYIGAAIKNIGAKEYNLASSFCGPTYVSSSDSMYAILKTQLDGGYYTAVDGMLSFLYFEDYHDMDGLLNYNIYDSKRNVVGSSSTHALSVRYGQNKYHLSMPDDLDNTSRNYFTLEVINEKKEKWMLRFYNDVSCNQCE